MKGWRRVWVTGVADPIAVGVELVAVRGRRAVVEDVLDPIAVAVDRRVDHLDLADFAYVETQREVGDPVVANRGKRFADDPLAGLEVPAEVDAAVAVLIAGRGGLAEKDFGGFVDDPVSVEVFDHAEARSAERRRSRVTAKLGDRECRPFQVRDRQLGRLTRGHGELYKAGSAQIGIRPCHLDQPVVTRCHVAHRDGAVDVSIVVVTGRRRIWQAERLDRETRASERHS